MGNSRTNNSIKNISSGLLAQAVQMVLGFVSRTVFIQYLSAEYLGVSSLFSNILTMLSLAELGIASAFIYELYKPLADKNEEQVAVILRYFKKAYHWVGISVFVIGLVLLPFLNDIIAEKPTTITEDIRIIYLFYIFNSASGYFFSYKISLLNADQKISVATAYTIKFSIAQTLLQILILILTQNFLLYLLVQILCQLASNIFVSYVVDKQYPFLFRYKTVTLNAQSRTNILTNVKATFFTKIGGVLVNGTDNIFISAFVGLAILGKYSNYVMLLGLVSSVLMIVFSNIQSSIAHFVLTETLERKRELFRTLNFLNFVGFGLTSLLFYFVVNDFVLLWIGKKYLLETQIALVMIVNFFMVGMQNAFWAFKSAHGFFKHGRFMVLGTAALNLVLSYFLGKNLGIFGILLATAISRLLTNFWYDPFIVLKLGLQENPLHYSLRFAMYLSILVLTGFSAHFIFQFIHFSPWILIPIKIIGVVTLFFSTAWLVLRNTEEPKLALAFIKRVKKSLKPS